MFGFTLPAVDIEEGLKLIRATLSPDKGVLGFRIIKVHMMEQGGLISLCGHIHQNSVLFFVLLLIRSQCNQVYCCQAMSLFLPGSRKAWSLAICERLLLRQR